MNSIDITAKEKQLLRDLAMNTSCEIDSPLMPNTEEENADSYYTSIVSGQTDHCRKYGFTDMLELRSELEELWRNEDYMHAFIPVVAAAAFKLRKNWKKTTVIPEQLRDAADRGSDLSSYIYIF